MKKDIIDFVSNIPENIAVDCALSGILIVGFSVIGFLSRSMVMELQANLMMMA